MSTTCRSILVAGLSGSEAAEAAVVSRILANLQQRTLPDGVELLDLGSRPSALLGRLSSCDALIIVDAAHVSDAPAGLLFDIDWHNPDRPQLVSDAASAADSHGSTLADQIALAESLDYLPDIVRLVAITVGEGPLGSMICPAVERQIPIAAQEVIMRCRKILFGEPIKPLAPRVDQQAFAPMKMDAMEEAS